MQVVHHGECAAAGFGYVVVVGGAVDERVSRVPGAFERDLDLLVLDQKLPGATASDLLHRIRQLGGELDLPVAVLMDSVTTDVQWLISAGATAVLPQGSPSDVARECIDLVTARRASAAA